MDCAVEGCARAIKARTWCKLHYQRWQKHGDPLTVQRIRCQTAEESFALRTEWQGDCLVWVGSLSGLGYGEISDNGKIFKAHRWAYERANGPIGKGLVIDHLCHNHPCCNVGHLRAVTQSVNLENRYGPTKANTSGYLNVYWDSRAEKWIVRVVTEGRAHYGGSYGDREEANKAAISLRSTLHRHVREVE